MNGLRLKVRRWVRGEGWGSWAGPVLEEAWVSCWVGVRVVGWWGLV